MIMILLSLFPIVIYWAAPGWLDQMHKTLPGVTRTVPYRQELRSILIVSQVTLVKDQDLPGAYVSAEIDGLQIGVEPAEGDKCERCWVHEPAVGSLPEHPTICPRCQRALAESGL